MDPFQHQLLDLAQNQIRLLRIQRGDSDQVECNLDIVPIAQHKYQALSYTWGPEHPIRTILLNGKAFQVRENLWWFLRYSAQGKPPFHLNTTECQSPPVYLWIDQLCINQSSTEEKNHQVQLMSEIYRCATQVTVWLGKEDENSDTAMDFIANAAQEYSRDDFDDRVLHLEHQAYLDEHDLEANCLGMLFRRPYWSRLWVVQEYLLASRLEIICGFKKVDGDELGLLYYFLNEYWSSFEKKFGQGMNLAKYRNILDSLARKDKGSRQDNYIETVLLNFGNLHCADPRDKVYGLLALVRKEDRIDVDYSKPSNLVFWEAVGNFQTERWSGIDQERFHRLGLAMKVTGQEQPAREEFARRKIIEIFNGLTPEEVFKMSVSSMRREIYGLMTAQMQPL